MSAFTDSFLSEPTSTLNGLILGAHPELVGDPDETISERIQSAYQELVTLVGAAERFQDALFQWFHAFQRRHQAFSRDYSSSILHQVLSAARRGGMSMLVNKMTEDSEYWVKWFGSYCFSSQRRRPLLEYCRLLGDSPSLVPGRNWTSGQIPFWRSVLLFELHSDYDASALAVLTYVKLVSSPPKIEDLRLDLFALCSRHALLLDERYGTQARKGWVAVWAKAFCLADVEPESRYLLSIPEDWREKLKPNWDVEKEKQRAKRHINVINTTPATPDNICEFPNTDSQSSSRQA